MANHPEIDILSSNLVENRQHGITPHDLPTEVKWLECLKLNESKLFVNLDALPRAELIKLLCPNVWRQLQLLLFALFISK